MNKKKLQKGGNITNTGYLPDSPDRFNPYNIIPSNNITMNTVPHDILAIPNKGKSKVMKKNSGKYKFPQADYVTEIPLYQSGGPYINDLIPQPMYRMNNIYKPSKEDSVKYKFYFERPFIRFDMVFLKDFEYAFTV